MSSNESNHLVFKLQHIHYTHTSHRNAYHQSIFYHQWKTSQHMTPERKNGYSVPKNWESHSRIYGVLQQWLLKEWTDISRWTHSRTASVPFWLWTMDYGQLPEWRRYQMMNLYLTLSDYDKMFYPGFSEIICTRLDIDTSNLMLI